MTKTSFGLNAQAAEGLSLRRAARTRQISISNAGQAMSLSKSRPFFVIDFSRATIRRIDLPGANNGRDERDAGIAV